DVRMAMRPWNRNYVGTHFGGSLFAMADPWFMVLLIELLGPGYVVWDKTGTIRFRKPGRGTVQARFEIPPERVEEIRRAVDAGGKVEPVFVARITDAAGETVAEWKSSSRSGSARRPDQRGEPGAAGPAIPELRPDGRTPGPR